MSFQMWTVYEMAIWAEAWHHPTLSWVPPDISPACQATGRASCANVCRALSFVVILLVAEKNHLSYFVPPDENFIGERAIGIDDTSLKSNMKCGTSARKSFCTPLHWFRLRHKAHIESYELQDGNIIIRSFVSVARKRCSSQSHWPPDSTTLSGTTTFYWIFKRMTKELTALSPSTMKPRCLLHQEFARQRRVAMRHEHVPKDG